MDMPSYLALRVRKPLNRQEDADCKQSLLLLSVHCAFAATTVAISLLYLMTIHKSGRKASKYHPQVSLRYVISRSLLLISRSLLPSTILRSQEGVRYSGLVGSGLVGPDRLPLGKH